MAVNSLKDLAKASWLLKPQYGIQTQAKDAIAA